MLNVTPKKDFKDFEELKKYVCDDCLKPKIKPTDYQKHLQTGDILLFSGNSHLSWRIKYVTPKQGEYRTIWNHVGMVLKLENPELPLNNSNLKNKLNAPNYFLIESIGVGVRIIPLELATKNYEEKKGYDGHILVTRHENFIDKSANIDQLNTIFNFVISHINTPFDNMDLARWAFRALMRKMPALIQKLNTNYYLSPKPPFVCTELVYHAYNSAGIKLNNTPGMITAEDIWRDNNLHPIGVIE
ncbi:MAG: hypothetical protein ACK4NY_24145 [Spirosomataceae bacterium]